MTKRKKGWAKRTVDKMSDEDVRLALDRLVPRLFGETREQHHVRIMDLVSSLPKGKGR